MTTRGQGRMTTARLLCTLLLLAGCRQHAGTASLQERERYGSLQPRVSTKKDVYQRFGQPVEVLAVDGGSTWLYAQAASPAGGLFTSGKTVGVILATFHFDAGDRYQRVDTDHERRPQPRERGTGGTPLGDAAAAHVRKEMERLELPFDEAVWDASAKAHRLWMQPLAAP